MRIINIKPTEDFVDLTIGRVYFKMLTNGVVNKVTIRSTIYGDVLNNALFFALIEYELVKLSNKKINKLSVKDGGKLREKTKEILLRHGLIEEEKKVEVVKDSFDVADEDVFRKQRDEMLARVKK